MYPHTVLVRYLIEVDSEIQVFDRKIRHHWLLVAHSLHTGTKTIMGLCASSSVKQPSSSTGDKPNPIYSSRSDSTISLPASPSKSATRSISSTTSEEQKVKELLGKRKARKKVVINASDAEDLDDSTAEELAQLIAARSTTEKEKAWIQTTLKNKFFLFNDLDLQMQNALIMCFEKRALTSGDAVINQGDSGDFMYIVESGTFSVEVHGKHVATLGEGALFGELALLYDAARAATVTATTDAVVWQVGRREFKLAVRLAAKRSQKTISETLQKVEILKNLNADQLAAIAKALEVSSPHVFRLSCLCIYT